MTISRRGVLLGATLAAATGACSRPKPHASTALDKVTVATGLGSYGREGFCWVAEAKGYFRDVGIEVGVVPGAAGEVNLNLLQSGKVQFAEIDYAGALVRAGNNAFQGLQMVGSLNRSNMMSIMTLPGRGITGPGDLPGKTVATAPGSVIHTLWPGYAALVGLAAGKTTWVNGNPAGLPELLATGKGVQAAGIPVAGAPSVAAAASTPAAKVPVSDVLVMPYSTFLKDLLGNVIVTTSAMVDAKPDLVRRFVTALHRGLQYTVNNPDECAHILHSAVPATDVDTAEAEMTLLRDWVAPDPWFRSTKVMHGIILLQSLGLTNLSITPRDVVASLALSD